MNNPDDMHFATDCTGAGGAGFAETWCGLDPDQGEVIPEFMTWDETRVTCPECLNVLNEEREAERYVE